MAAQHVQLFQQHESASCASTVGLPRPFAGGVFLHRGFELVADADVVHHQAALLVLEHAVDAGNGLHQVVALHGFVHVHGVHAGRVKAGEPHVAHDDQAQRVGRVFEALFQPLLDLAAVDVRAQQSLVAGTAGHHHLDGALLRVGAVPVGAQATISSYRCTQMSRLMATTMALPSWALLRSSKCATRSAATLATRGVAPTTFSSAAQRLLSWAWVLSSSSSASSSTSSSSRARSSSFSLQLGQAAFVIDGHRGAVFLGLLHVVDMDVVAKHGAGVAVGAADRRAGEGHKGGVGQRIAQVLGVAGLVVGGVLGRSKLGVHGAAARIAGHYAFELLALVHQALEAYLA
jgi:hypothetical protein